MGEKTKLQEMRIKAGKTQKEAAEICGISLGVWRHYEQGSRKFDGAGLEIIIRTALALNCSIEDLIESDDTVALLKEYKKR